MKIYLPWLAIPVALLLAGVLLLPERESAREDLPRDALVGPGKGMSALEFHALARGGVDKRPLHTVNHQGLTIDIAIDPATYKHMLIRGVRNLYKRRTTNVGIRFGELKPCPAILRARGASSLKRGDRINFAINLLSPVMITPDIELSRFYLLNMVSDPLEFKLEFACRLLQKLDLFPCYHQYVKVLVNGEPQGMFLLVERPRNAIRRVHPGTVSVFRRGRQVFRPQWSKSVPHARQQIETLKRITREGAGDVATALEEVIDLDAYLTWMATNSVLKNSDTVDELFLFEVREDRNVPEPLRFMAWDYDEILEDQYTTKILADSLLFVRRNTPLDVLLKDDPELYARYRASLRRVLTLDLPIDYLVKTLREVETLRSGLDDGLPTEVQDERRRERTEVVGRFEEDLRERHATLLERLEDRG